MKHNGSRVSVKLKTEAKTGIIHTYTYIILYTSLRSLLYAVIMHLLCDIVGGFGS